MPVRSGFWRKGRLGVALKVNIGVDLFGLHISGRDAFGDEFSIALEPADARSLIFKMHRMILEVERLRVEVKATRGGGKAA